MHGEKRKFKTCPHCQKNAWREIYSGAEKKLGRQCTVCSYFVKHGPEDEK